MIIIFLDFSQDSCLAHSKGSEIFIFEIEQENRVMTHNSPNEKGKTTSISQRILLDLKTMNDIDKSISIILMKVHQIKQHLVILGTTHGNYFFGFFF